MKQHTVWACQKLLMINTQYGTCYWKDYCKYESERFRSHGINAVVKPNDRNELAIFIEPLVENVKE